MAINEDIDYTVSDFATPDQKVADPEQPNKPVLLDTIEYIDAQIKKYDSLDLIDPSAENTMTTQQQVAVMKEVLKHLRSVRSTLNKKVKELK